MSWFKGGEDPVLSDKQVIPMGARLHYQGRRHPGGGAMAMMGYDLGCKSNDHAFDSSFPSGKTGGYFITNGLDFIKTDNCDIDYGAERNGGVIAFAANIVPCEALFDKVKQGIISGAVLGLDADRGHKTYIGSLAAGNFFRGKFRAVDEYGFKELFDDPFNYKSPCVEVRGLITGDLIRLAQYLCKEFGLRMALVMDYNFELGKKGRNKYYAVLGEGKCDYLTVRYRAGRGGRVENDSGHAPKELLIKSGASGRCVVATADKGYRFESWSDGVKTAKRIDVNITSDIDVVAKFFLIEYEWRYEAGEGGFLIGHSPQIYRVSMKDGVYAAKTVAAMAKDGYEFVSWSDGERSIARKDINVRSDLCVTAIFAPVK